ncbi:MAG: protease complex subunit PrcB family protein [Gemmatimonas sp.]
MKYPLIFALTMAIAVAAPPRSLAFVRLYNGANSGFTRNSDFVIQDADEFARRWKGVLQGDPEAAMPEVNFEKTTVMLVATGIRNTDGHSVRVDSVVKETNVVTVHYTVTSPGGRCMSLQILSSPIEVISLDKLTGAVKFKKHDVKKGC